MPRFFISSSAVSDGKALLVGDDAHHISRSLRMRAGENLVLCDGEGKDYSCTIDNISDREVAVDPSAYDETVLLKGGFHGC